jgi:hypothetical protein
MAVRRWALLAALGDRRLRRGRCRSRRGRPCPSCPVHQICHLAAEGPRGYVVTVAWDAVGARGSCADLLIRWLIGARERDRVSPRVERDDAERGGIRAGRTCVVVRPFRKAGQHGLHLYREQDPGIRWRCHGQGGLCGWLRRTRRDRGSGRGSGRLWPDRRGLPDRGCGARGCGRVFGRRLRHQEPGHEPTTHASCNGCAADSDQHPATHVATRSALARCVSTDRRRRHVSLNVRPKVRSLARPLGSCFACCVIRRAWVRSARSASTRRT